MTFVSDKGRQTTVAVENPRDDLNSDAVRKAMERLIESKVFIGRDKSSCKFIRKASVIKRTVKKIM